MTIERRYPYGPLEDARLRAFEARLPSRLPLAYREFLLQFNGATVRESEDFTEVPGETRVDTLFGLHDGPPHYRLDAMRENFMRGVPEMLLIVGDDPYGNYFGLVLAGPQQGSVVFVDHERLPVDLSSVTRVAVSFEALRQCS